MNTIRLQNFSEHMRTITIEERGTGVEQSFTYIKNKRLLLFRRDIKLRSWPLVLIEDLDDSFISLRALTPKS